MAGWTRQQKSPHRSAVHSHSPDSWHKPALIFQSTLTLCPKAYMQEQLNRELSSSVPPKNVFSVSKEGVDGGV